MKKNTQLFVVLFLVGSVACTCTKKTSHGSSVVPATDTLVNLSHLNYLYTPVTMPNGSQVAGIYVYSNAPNYALVDATGEGFTCVDDVSRAVLVYIRKSNFSTDTSLQNKAFKLIGFLIAMQSPNGYFYNFLQLNDQINTNGPTSINTANWWSWRALQALTEAQPILQSLNPALAGQAGTAVNQLVAQLKADQVNIARTTTTVSGVTIPQWLPAGSGSDQASPLILGLIPYCTTNNDPVMYAYLKKLADGVVMMQAGGPGSPPYDCILSWQNTWHAYGADQAYALLKAGQFFHDSSYTLAGIAFVDNFINWLLTNGIQSSFDVTATSSLFQMGSESTYPQIAYDIRPLVFAAVEAYNETNNPKYADIAGHLAAWFFGHNAAGIPMYSTSTGICYDGLTSSTSVNQNSGGESTIEALLTMERVDLNPSVATALQKYRNP